MIQVDLNKAKGIAHEVRRSARAELFKPLDVQATIPMYAAKAEQERQAIREQFEQHQHAIDSATCAESLKAAMLKCKECK